MTHGAEGLGFSADTRGTRSLWGTGAARGRRDVTSWVYACVTPGQASRVGRAPGRGGTGPAAWALPAAPTPSLSNEQNLLLQDLLR